MALDEIFEGRQLFRDGSINTNVSVHTEAGNHVAAGTPELRLTSALDDPAPVIVSGWFVDGCGVPIDAGNKSLIVGLDSGGSL